MTDPSNIGARAKASVLAGRSDSHIEDSIELVLIAPGREHVLVRTEFPRTIHLHPASARELARQLERCAEVVEG